MFDHLHQIRGEKNSIIEAWLSLVERCVREHRTLGARYRAVCGTLPLTLHCHGVFGNLKSRSKNLLTTCLTTSVENPYFEAWLSLVERCVRDAEVVGSNPVASTIKNRLNKGFKRFFLYMKYYKKRLKSVKKL